MLAGKRKRALSVLMSLMMVLSMGIPSGVYGTEHQSHVHIHGNVGFCSDGYYYTGKYIPVTVKETDTTQVAIGVQPVTTSGVQTVTTPGEQPTVTTSGVQTECPEVEDGSNITPEAVAAPDQTAGVFENQADLNQQTKNEGTSDQTKGNTEKQKDLNRQRDTVKVSDQPVGVFDKPIGVSGQTDTVKSTDQKEEKGADQEEKKSDDTKVIYQCERYPYFTVTFVDGQEKNKQTEVNVVPALPDQFPLIAPDFKDQKGNSVESWVDQNGNPVELERITSSETVYAKWAEQDQLLLLQNAQMVPSKDITEYHWEDKSNGGKGGGVCVEYYQNNSMHDWASGTTLPLPRNAFPFFFVKASPGYENVTACQYKDKDSKKKVRKEKNEDNQRQILNQISRFGYQNGDKGTEIGGLHETPRYTSDFLRGSVLLTATAHKLGNTSLYDIPLTNYIYAHPAQVGFNKGILAYRYSLDGTDQIDSSQINLSDYQYFFYWSPWLNDKQASGRTIQLTADKKPDSTLTYKANAEGEQAGGIPDPVNCPTDFETSLKFDGIVRDGYEFLGWSENPRAESPDYTKEKPKILMDEDKTLYAVWNKKTDDPKSIEAKFFIRLDGQIPIENDNTQYAHADYTTKDLFGKVDGEACWTDYHGVIDNITGKINGTLVEKAFASIQAHIIAPPPDLEIKTMLEHDQNAQNQNLTFNPDTQRVIWYVAKKVSGDRYMHVDGVICSKTAHVMLQYHENAGNDKVEGIPSMQLYEKNDNAPIIFKGITRKGYEFLGWSQDPNATPENIEFPISEEKATIYMDGEKHLYAVWKENKPPSPELVHSIYYKENAPIGFTVSGMPVNGEKKKDGIYELSKIQPACTAGIDRTYEFGGWSLSDGKDGKVQVPTTYVELKGTDVTVYAIWQSVPKDDPSGGGDQGGGTDPGDQGGGGQTGGDTHDRDHHDRDNNGSEPVTIPDSEVPLASQPVNPPEVIIPEQAIPLAAHPGEQNGNEEATVPLAGITKLPKTGGIGAGLVGGIGVLLIAAGLLLKRRKRKETER